MRYLVLYMHFLRFSLTKVLQFRFNFFFRIIMDLFYHLSNIFIFKFLFKHTQSIENWSEEEVLVFAGSYILVDGIYMTFFSTNSWWFPLLVNKGDLDYYLVRPISAFFFLSLREFAVNSFINLIFAIAIFIWAISNPLLELNFFEICAYILLILNGSIIYHLLTMLFYMPVFWTGSPRGLENIFYGIANIMRYPHKIQGTVFRFIFTFLLPINLVNSIPTSFLFDENRYQTFFLIFATSLIFYIIFHKIWKKALKSYSSASS